MVPTSAILSSPVQSTVSIETTQPVFYNTVAPSRYNPYQEKTMFLEGKIDRKTAITVVHNLRSIDCPYFPADVVPPHEYADFLTLLQRSFPWTRKSRSVNPGQNGHARSSA